MENQELPYSGLFAQGTGGFPYIVLRPKENVYVLFPIFYKTEFLTDKPLFQFEKSGITIFLPDSYSINNLEGKILPELFLNLQHEYEKLCLVLGPERAFYIENNSIRQSHVVPEGGMVFSGTGLIIGCNDKHFDEPRELRSSSKSICMITPAWWEN